MNKLIQYILFVLLPFFIISANCTKSDSIAHTKWSYYFSPNDTVGSYFVFKDSSKYSFYNGELGETTYGTYMLNMDTLFLHQEYGEYDTTFRIGSRHRAGESDFRLILNHKNELGFFELWNDEIGIWKENYFFTKENKRNK